MRDDPAAETATRQFSPSAGQTSSPSAGQTNSPSSGQTSKFLRATLDALSAHIAVLDPAGTILEVNRPWEEFARSNQSCAGANGIGLNYLAVCDRAAGEWSEEAPKVAAAIRAIVSGELPFFHLEYPCHSPEQRRYFEVRISRFAGDGPARVVVAHENITARKVLEDELIDARKMETVGRLAGGLAHELNSLLTSILLHGELMMADLPANESVARPGREIRKAAHQAAELVRQVLAYSRKQFLRPEPVDLDRLVAGLEPMLRLLLGRGILVEIRAGQPPVRVVADAGQLEQVLIQLAIFARDGMPKGGQLRLESARVALTLPSPPLAPGRYVVLEVSDTGPGLGAAVQAHLFEPFFSPRGLAQRHGLGLSSAYGIVRQSGGDLRVASVLGQGTTFALWLPELEASGPA